MKRMHMMTMALVATLSASALAEPPDDNNLPGGVGSRVTEPSKDDVKMGPQTPSEPGSVLKDQPVTKLAAGDQKFVKTVSQTGLQEVMLSEMAQDRAQAQSVTKFAMRMVGDHSKANAELSAMSTSRGQPPPIEPAASFAAIHKRLGKLNGPAFDRAFMRVMVTDHQKAAALLRKQTKRTQDALVKKLIADQLPVIEAHLTVALAVQRDLARGVSNTDVDRMMEQAMPRAGATLNKPGMQSSPRMHEMLPASPSSPSKDLPKTLDQPRPTTPATPPY